MQPVSNKPHVAPPLVQHVVSAPLPLQAVDDEPPSVVPSVTVLSVDIESEPLLSAVKVPEEALVPDELPPDEVGPNVGAIVGGAVDATGATVPKMLGVGGVIVGEEVGGVVGAADGVNVGAAVGLAVGMFVGTLVGEEVPYARQSAAPSGGTALKAASLVLKHETRPHSVHS